MTNLNVKRKCPFEDFDSSRASTTTTMAAKNNMHDDGGKKTVHVHRHKPEQWEKHAEAAMGYYFHINGQKYCYVTEYQGSTLVHLRIYDENKKTGQLIPTKTGCCLRTDEWATLRRVGAEVQGQLAKMDGNSDVIMRRPLGSESNWYILCGQGLHGRPAVTIRLLMPAKNQRSNELCSTSKGLTFDEDEWKKFVAMFDDIDVAVKSIDESV